MIIIIYICIYKYHNVGGKRGWVYIYRSSLGTYRGYNSTYSNVKVRRNLASKYIIYYII